MKTITHSIDSGKASIIIAAYNEAAVIRGTLQSLYSTEALDVYQIIVICNGCTDQTAEIVQNEFPNVNCLNLATPSKSLAIRLAETMNPGFPRLYLDADISLSATDAIALIRQSNTDTAPHLIVPSSNLDTSQSSWLVKSYYRVWYRTRHVQKSGFGAGTYLINASARTRFNEWPELIADDAFIRSQLSENEIHLAKKQCVSVKAPKNIYSLIKAKSRSKLGNMELKSFLTGLPNNNNLKEKHSTFNFKSFGPTKVQGSDLHRRDLIVYYSVNIIALCYAKWQQLRNQKTWLRDNSNR